MNEFLIWAVPLAALAASLGCIVSRVAKRDRLAPFIATAGLLVSTIAALAFLVGGAHEPIREFVGYHWLGIGGIQIEIGLRLDALSIAMLAMVNFVSLMVAWYSTAYMKEDPGVARYFAVFCGFVFSMSMLVLSSNLLATYVFWEGVGLCSYLLIGFWYQRPAAARAATKAFLVNRIADSGFLLGIVLLWHGMGMTLQDASAAVTYLDFDAIFSHANRLAQEHPVLTSAIGFLLLLGAVGKSAQFPLHVWLPDAMEGPTPVSALIHAATMVTAGVYLLCRMAPLLVFTPEVLIAAGWLGGITAILAAWMALFQHDLKRVLAYSTVSQLGYMFMALGTGAVSGLIELAVAGAVFHLITHAFFKALLFLSAGNVMHAMGDVIDMRRFGGLRIPLPKTHLAFAIGVSALAGLPPLAGFWSKDGILHLLWEAGSHASSGSGYRILFAIALLTALLTALYGFRAYFRTFWGNTRVPIEAGDHPHEGRGSLINPLAVLAVGAVVLGVVLGITRPLASFLYPKLSAHMGLDTVALMAVSTVVALAGVILAWRFLRSDPPSPSTGWFATLGRNQLFLNELYEAMIVRPLQGLATSIAFLESHVIDPVARFIGRLPQWIGSQGRVLQDGMIGTYSFVAIISLLVLWWFVLSR